MAGIGKVLGRGAGGGRVEEEGLLGWIRVRRVHWWGALAGLGHLEGVVREETAEVLGLRGGMSAWGFDHL